VEQSNWIPSAIEKTSDALNEALPLLDKHSGGFWRLLYLIVTVGAVVSIGSIAVRSKPLEFKAGTLNAGQNFEPCRFVNESLLCDR
jgi:hypothetical protein